MLRSDDPDECPQCGKEMRRRWSWFPFCSSRCVEDSHDEQEADADY